MVGFKLEDDGCSSSSSKLKRFDKVAGLKGGVVVVGLGRGAVVVGLGAGF